MRDLESESNNVILFPAERIVRLMPSGIVTAEDFSLAAKRAATFRKVIAREYLAVMAPTILNMFATAGFDLTSVQTSTDAALIIESVKSFIDKQFRISHPFHQISKEIFTVDPDTDLISLNTNSDILKNLKQEEETEENEVINVGDTEQSRESSDERRED